MVFCRDVNGCPRGCGTLSTYLWPCSLRSVSCRIYLWKGAYFASDASHPQSCMALSPDRWRDIGGAYSLIFSVMFTILNGGPWQNKRSKCQRVEEENDDGGIMST